MKSRLWHWSIGGIAASETGTASVRRRMRAVTGSSAEICFCRMRCGVALKHRSYNVCLNAALLKQSHPSVAAAFDAGSIKRACVVEMGYVTPKRQEEILKAMENYKDYTVPFARSLVRNTLSTPLPRTARA